MIILSNTINLYSDSSSIIYLSSHDRRLSKVIELVGPISYSTHNENPYAFLVHEIIEQMLSIKAGAQIYNRLLALCNGEITPNTIDKLSNEQIQSIGTSKSKVEYIRGITNSIINNEIDLHELNMMSDEDVYKKLISLRGIGSWTAKMYLIFVLDRQDILPFEDVAFLQSFCWMLNKDNCDKEYIIKYCGKWKPYSSIAARYLYRALDTGLTKSKFHLYK